MVLARPSWTPRWTWNPDLPPCPAWNSTAIPSTTTGPVASERNAFHESSSPNPRTPTISRTREPRSASRTTSQAVHPSCRKSRHPTHSDQSSGVIAGSHVKRMPPNPPSTIDAICSPANLGPPAIPSA
ncbi:hypothetical protein OV079_20060 [Nannocystis pusilla]|uniref:Uncharacterized protein n=1 Tax=Nannocystis pusilla TaxID=889268 RepID=A0A9X3EPZ1_9BACT|nr:hypothetical protein [Nannocystis pusilla]MCY1007805.1 hypothetical protein [Nannocystis pusilla]